MILATLLATNMLLAAPSEPEFAELVVLMDTSGSTDISQKALRGYALERAENQLEYYGKGRFRLAFITYAFGVTQARVHNFTTNPQLMVEYLAGPITLDGGKEEATDIAMAALKNLNWSYGKKVKRMMLVMGNEPPKQGLTTIQAVADKAAEGKVSINTYFTPYHPLAGSPDPWAEWAQKGNGEFRFMSESDLVSYTNLYDSYHRQLLLDKDTRIKAAYLKQLMDRRQHGQRSGGK